MSVATWNAPSTQGSNIASTSLDSLASAGTSAFVTYDNSTNLDLYAGVEILLGSITSTTGASLTLRVFATQGTGPTVPDASGSVNGGDTYVVPMLVGAGAKTITIPMIRLYPFSLRLCITNNSGVAFAASGNSLKLTPYNEKIV